MQNPFLNSSDKDDVSAAVVIKGVSGWTKAWRSGITVFLALSGYWNYNSRVEATTARTEAQIAKKQIIQLKEEVDDLNSKLTVVSIFLSVQKEAQKSASKKKEYQDVIDILRKPRKETSQNDLPDIRATEDGYKGN